MYRYPRLQVFARSRKEFIDRFRVNFLRVICPEMKQKARVGAEGRLNILGGGRACKRATERHKTARIREILVRRSPLSSKQTLIWRPPGRMDKGTTIRPPCFNCSRHLGEISSAPAVMMIRS